MSFIARYIIAVIAACLCAVAILNYQENEKSVLEQIAKEDVARYQLEGVKIK